MNLAQEAGVGDFVLLPTIDMDNFLSNLEVRYKAGYIYTYIGEVCVSVNPYKGYFQLLDLIIVELKSHMTC